MMDLLVRIAALICLGAECVVITIATAVTVVLGVDAHTQIMQAANDGAESLPDSVVEPFALAGLATAGLVWTLFRKGAL